MDINKKVLNRLLLGLFNSDDITIKCKEEISRYLGNYDINVFSSDSLKELAGIWQLSLGPAYESLTGQYAPNIFVTEEEYGNSFQQ